MSTCPPCVSPERCASDEVCLKGVPRVVYTGGPAFPATTLNQSDVNVTDAFGNLLAPHSNAVYPGMTLRDYFAAKAPISLADAVAMKAVREIGNDVGVIQLAHATSAPSASFNSAVFEVHTRLCYEWADAMLRAKEEK